MPNPSTPAPAHSPLTPKPPETKQIPALNLPLTFLAPPVLY
jgi:hypothetical protein